MNFFVTSQDEIYITNNGGSSLAQCVPKRTLKYTTNQATNRAKPKTN